MINVSLLTISYTVQIALLELFHLRSFCSKYADILRDEAAKALESTGGIWTFDSIGKLKLLDSAIRESMRESPMGPLMLAWTVSRSSGERLMGSEQGYHQGRPQDCAESAAGSNPL